MTDFTDGDVVLDTAVADAVASSSLLTHSDTSTVTLAG
jgi:hypothetical protein